MSTPQAGVVTPYQGAISGQVVDRKSEIAHDFFNIVRSLIRQSGVFREEEHVLSALRAVDSYSRSVLGSEHVRVQREGEPAPVEDVTQRKPPLGTMPTVSGPPIDYRALAEAMYAVQQAHAQQNNEPPPAQTGDDFSA